MSRKRKRDLSAPQARLRLPDFDYHVNNAAIIDRVDLSVYGSLKQEFTEHELSKVINKPIFRPGRFYAACIFAKWRLTRNPVMIRHGKMTKFKNVPQLHFTFRSEHIPLTAAQLQLLIRRCICQRKRRK